MTKKVILCLLLLGNYILLSAQLRNEKADSLRYYAYSRDTSNTILDSLELSIDSIHVRAIVYVDRIIATNYFVKSKTQLRTEFYLQNNTLVFVKIIEKSPLLQDLERFTEFYLEDCQIFYESYYRSIRICMPVNLKSDWDAPYGYNKNIDTNFLKRYISYLFKLITGSTCFRLFV